MANHKSAEKRIRQTATRTERNRYYKTRIKNITRSLRESIEQKDLEKAQVAFKIVNKEFHKFVSKGILTKNTAARKVSRLNTALKKLSQSL
ncbi:30S ribosomal protein S20 [Helicobacter fennelliae]|uniref:Small ribosomal subunit protein bS20 n=2 Tax=Helicobacter fennelliae TaxID=215 RepID=T1CRJ3_9HELI|nr:30S ribosomal protein S20 [Helicobacter fennelliae]GAD19394.1 SSU ribosomal protein S20p [Helicobacter fennelliae MRY12-0050]SQB99198.1 30S ribosomal protein S20 [Helicobacter fennelliae]STP08436.1 30S ribosomal protein S20 [Helicobacter fennelliae]STQ84851.1 30S ribosomal protein S20 [Helicobacter fennelliae]